MNLTVAVAADLIAISILVFAIYYRRHFRRDLVLAYVALNVGIMVVTALLLDSGAGIGLGMGLFGILSIIRLRSDAITQEEVAYYFVALAMGLVNEVLSTMGVRPESISKYCIGIALTNPEVPANKWNRMLRNRFGWQRRDAAA